MTQAVIEAAGPLDTPARKALLASLHLDTVKIDSLLQQEEDEDPDYVDKLRANLLGFFMEEYVACHMKCPLCGASLLIYENPQMPAVDLICSNKEKHLAETTCFLYQVKITTQTDSTYFDLGRRFISVGSRTYGEIVHSVSPHTPRDDRWICPGYICLRVDVSRSNTYHLQRGSFILIPDYHCRDLDEPFYRYISGDGDRPQITWNPKCVRTEPITKRLPSSINAEEIYWGYQRIVLDE